MTRGIGSLRSATVLLMAGGLAGGLAACGGGSGGGSSSGNMPVLDGPALDMAITADPASTAPDLLSADGSGTPADNTMLEEMADADIATIEGWDPIVYERTTASDSTDTFVIYSNKGEPTPTAFHMVHPLDSDGALVLDNSNLGLVSGVAEFPSAVNQAGVPFMDGAEFTGMFDGAPGTYTCVSMCELSTNLDADLVAVVGDWQFAPDDDEFLVPVDDSDFVHFGYWQNETEVAGDSTYMVAPSAGGTVESAIGTVQMLEGRATYTGAATGLYVTRTYSLDGEVVSRTGGQFTADAMLTATFGGGGVPALSHYSIVGSIKDFVDRGGRATDSIDSSWSVELKAARFGSQRSGDLTGTNGNVFGNATEGDQDMMGGWSGRFFGTIDDTTSGNQSTLPSAVAGTFDAQFTNGVVIGSFGAEKDD